MPTYEYACQKCRIHIEIVQSFKDEPPEECAHCGGPLRKVFHPVGIVLKGSGFYKTDSRPKKSDAGESVSTPSSSPSSSPAEKGEKKTEKKTGSTGPADKQESA